MKLLLIVFLLLSSFNVYASVLDDEFFKFFGEKQDLSRLSDSEITYFNENNLSISIKINFKLKFVKKLLVLKIPECGYGDSGYPKPESCVNEPVVVATYIYNPNINVQFQHVRMQTRCNRVRLIFWIQTKDNYYYDNYISFPINLGHDS